MGRLADALGYEKQFTISGISFTARRLNLSEILACTAHGVKITEGVSYEQALDMAEDLIYGEDGRILFPQAGIEKLIATASSDIDEKDVRAMASLLPDDLRRVCRFVLGLDESETPTATTPAKPKKKARQWIGFGSILRCASILAKIWQRYHCRSLKLASHS
jgi:hypothetical protein